MAKTVTLEGLRGRAKTRADMVKSKFVSDAEWNDFINRSLERFYDMLVAADQDYYTVDETISTNGSASEFDLAADFYKLVSVDYMVGGQRRPMKKYTRAERGARQGNPNALMYRLKRNKLSFNSTPSAQTIYYGYVPAFEDLVDDADEFDGVNGWDELVVLDAARKALVKAEKSTAEIEKEFAVYYKEIEAKSKTRDIGAPERVQDVSGGLRSSAYDLQDEDW
jgi:hypothetical protein